MDDTRRPKCVMFRELMESARCVEVRGGPGKRVDGVCPGRPQSFGYQHRPVKWAIVAKDEWEWRNRSLEHFMAKQIAAEKARPGLRYAVLVCPKRGSTIGESGDTTISSPGRSTKQPLPGIGLHDPLHGRQACPEFIAFDQEVGQICLR